MKQTSAKYFLLGQSEHFSSWMKQSELANILSEIWEKQGIFFALTNFDKTSRTIRLVMANLGVGSTSAQYPQAKTGPA